MTIGFFAAAPPVFALAATAVPIAVSTATPTSSTAHLPRPLMLLLPVVIPRLESTRRYPVNADPVSPLPDAVECVPSALGELGCGNVPERALPRVPKRSVVAEDLEVVVPVPPGGLERTEDRRQVSDAVSREHAVRPPSRRLAPVRDVHADESLRLAPDVVEQGLGVPEVPRVELQAERPAIGGLDEVDRFGDRRDDRPVLSADPVDRLEPDANTGALGLGADRPETVDDELAGLVWLAVLRRSRPADDTARPERREPVQRRADRLDPCLRVLRAFQERQREDRGDRRDGGR